MTIETSTEDSGENAGKPMSLTRRQFLTGAAAVGASALAPAPAMGKSQARTDDWPEEFVVNPTDDGRFSRPGEISREGYRKLAEAEYQAQQKGQLPTFKKRVHAVKDLGLDPNGNEPAQDKLASAAEPDTLIVCPKGSEFRITGNLIASVDGPFGIVGEGYKRSKRPPGPNDKDAVIFNIDNDAPTVVEFRTPSGLFANFALDQRGRKQMVSLRFNTNGYQLVRDLRTIGPHSNAYSKGTQYAGPALAPETPAGATVRVVRYANVGGGKSGTKEKGGMPIVWVGTGHHGTLQLINCHVENSPDNGLYGGRTPGNTEIYGGLWRNNDVSQVRTSGKGSRVDGATVVLDEKQYKGLGSKSGFPSSNGIKWDSKPTQSNDPAGGEIVNCDIRGLSEAGDEYGVGSLIAVFPTAGAVTIENTRIVNKIDATPISADEPNGNSYPPPPQPHRVIVKNSLVGGRAEQGAITIRGRQRSLVKKVCLKYSGAGPSDIQGAGTSGVSYGRQCGDAGLSNPDKVGGGGKLPPLPDPGNGTPAPATPDFSERNPGILDGIANWFEDKVQAFENTIRGFAKMIILVIFGPFIALALGAVLFVGVFFVVLLLAAAGLKALKE